MALVDLSPVGAATKPLVPVVDIIAVHGLYEGELQTWTKDSVLWLRDVFPSQNYGARMLTYCYDAADLLSPGGTAANSIYNEALRLVVEIAAERTIQKASRRPIVFICHGFGGLLVKRALAFSHSRRDPQAEHLRSVALCTTAILFMATPHHGITKDALMIAQTDDSTPNHLMLNLLENSEMLQEVSDQFAPLVKNLQISAFWETLDTKFANDSRVLVEKESAAPPEWADVEKCGISATHSTIVKFSSAASPGYTLVFAALHRYTTKAAEIVKRRFQQETDLLKQNTIMEMEYLRTILHEDDDGGTTMSSTASSVPSLRHAALPWTAQRSKDEETPVSPFVNVHYLVRRRSDFFVGRREQARLLREHFGYETCRQPKVFVIYGLPGSGKTQFCLKYLEDRHHRYWGVFWIDCSSEANAESSYASLARQAGKGGDPGGGIQWLCETTSPWLLVLDNANSPELDLSALLPSSGNGHILITTRNPNAQIYNNIGRFQFKGMDPEEAITMLLKLAYPDKDTQHSIQAYRQPAEVIASELGYLALALKQAAITIRRDLMTLEGYLKSLLGWRKRLLSSSAITSAPEANIIATWEIPFKEITKGSSPRYKDAVDLMHLLAFMHYAMIPHVLFSRASDRLKQGSSLKMHIGLILEPQTAQEVEDRVRRATALLFEHSIITISELDMEPSIGSAPSKPTLYLSLHPAIHQWARDRLDKTQQHAWLECSSSLIAASFSSDMETSGALFRRQLLPHIESCVSLMEGTSLHHPGNPERINNIEKFALVYAENGFWKRAKALQHKVLEFRMTFLGPRHKATMFAQRMIATTHWNLFEIDACMKVQNQLRQSLWWLRPSIQSWLSWPPWQPNHHEYLISLDDLARSLWLAGRRELSAQAAKRAVAGLSRSFGPEDPITLNAMFNLARTYLHIGKHNESYELLTHVLEKRIHFFGHHHPDTLMTKNEVGMNLCAQGIQLHKAKKMILEVVEARKVALGEEHAYTLWSINDLSKVYCELGEPERAVQILQDILPIVERTLGSEHVGMIMTKSNLSRAFILSGRWGEAGVLIRALRNIIPPDHPDWIHANWGYAYVLTLEEREEEAETCCKELLRHISDTGVLEMSHPRVGAIAEILLHLYSRQNRKEDIITLKSRFPQLQDTSKRSSIDHLAIGPLRRRRTETIQANEGL